VLRNLPGKYAVPGNPQHLFNVGSFIAMAVVLALLLMGFAHASAVAGEHRTGPRTSFAALLPSMVPIAFGYLFAHNFEYLVLNSQLLFPLIGNPPGLESWPIHLPFPFNDSFEPHLHVLPSSFYWYAAVVVIVAVHVAAVVIAHRHLVAVAQDERLERRSELPWLVAMVGYTCLSLWLLAQPLTETTSTTSGSGNGATGPPAVSVAPVAADVTP
jgi:hypothetical protein